MQCTVAVLPHQMLLPHRMLLPLLLVNVMEEMMTGRAVPAPINVQPARETATLTKNVQMDLFVEPTTVWPQTRVRMSRPTAVRPTRVLGIGTIGVVALQTVHAHRAKGIVTAMLTARPALFVA